jgi:EEF1A lysine methyltransferase 4
MLIFGPSQKDFAGERFDVAIDKSTLDTMLYGSLWDPDSEVRENVGAYVDEVARALIPGGRWLHITYRQPHFLRPLLETPKDVGHRCREFAI